jgi:hypothetical protein
LENQWRSHSEPERDQKADDAPHYAPEPQQLPKVTAPEAA